MILKKQYYNKKQIQHFIDNSISYKINKSIYFTNIEFKGYKNRFGLKDLKLNINKKILEELTKKD